MDELVPLQRVFGYEGKQVRIAIKNGEPWWVAKDVCEVLDYIWNGTSRIEHVPAEWRGVTSIVTPSGTQEMAVLSEQGLYFFLARSDKPKALPFQMWIAGDVVPAIRKTGHYDLTEFQGQAIPKTLPDALRLAADLEERRQALADQVKELEPKAEVYDQTMSAENALEMNDAAKALGWGRNRLFEELRSRKILRDNNTPYQEHLEAGRFRVRVTSFPIGDRMIERAQTLVTPKGLDYLCRTLKRGRGEATSGVVVEQERPA